MMGEKNIQPQSMRKTQLPDGPQLLPVRCSAGRKEVLLRFQNSTRRIRGTIRATGVALSLRDRCIIIAERQSAGFAAEFSQPSAQWLL